MEVLLAACLLAWAAGAQSEQAKLGISPAQRALIRENVRHEKTVRKIAERHGDVAPFATGGDSAPVTIPEAFRAGYRNRAPQTAIPAAQRAGDWAARGVIWAKDTGRKALAKHRANRKAQGQPDPAPVLTPPIAGEPPAATQPDPAPIVIPPHPSEPPTVGQPAPDPAPAPSPNADLDSIWGGALETEAKAEPVTQAAPTPPKADLDSIWGGADPALQPPTTPTLPPTPSGPDPTQAVTIPNPQAPEGGAGRMAAEVTYESVSAESDELSLMCDDDLTVYDRLQGRCEREIGRADELIAALQKAGAGDRVTGWVTRCMEQYQLIHGQLGQLKQHTYAQDEAVVKAKKLLEAGQGVYAGIAADMESVAERVFYVGDQVDSEDANAHADIYETTGA